MHQSSSRSIPFSVGSLQAPADPFAQGLHYLYHVRRLAPDATMVDLIEDLGDRTRTYLWISRSIDGINAQLHAHLESCQHCFRDDQWRSVQILAAPLVDSLKLDGYCHLQTHPITILLDVGRVEPEDWLGLVAHEYAHAHIGQPGHSEDYAAVLAHLCLGLGLAVCSDPAHLPYWPPYRPTQNSLAFWMGEASSGASLTKDGEFRC